MPCALSRASSSLVRGGFRRNALTAARRSANFLTHPGAGRFTTSPVFIFLECPFERSEKPESRAFADEADVVRPMHRTLRSKRRFEMLKTLSIERQLPHGVADVYFQEAARKTQLETRLHETFAQWNYTQVIPPTFEYYEALAAEASPQVREEIYRFPDRDGRMLALRADPTIPIARLVSTKLYDQTLPLRFFYIA